MRDTQMKGETREEDEDEGPTYSIISPNLKKMFNFIPSKKNK